MHKPYKILVTGGSGYIGENIKKTYTLGSIDICDYNMGNLPLAHELKLEHLEGYNGIVHLAALSGIAACEENPTRAVQENLLTAMNVFNLANRLDIPVIFTSSQAAKTPKSSTYAFMKWACEQMAKWYNSYGASIYVFRLSNVYGGHGYLEKKSTCVKQFITKYNNGELPVVHGDGKQKRDFIHVYDVCTAIGNCLAFKPEYKGPYDIGTGIGTSILQLKAMFPKKDFVTEERDVGTDSSIADTSMAEKHLLFKAKYKLRDYIKESIKC